MQNAKTLPQLRLSTDHFFSLWHPIRHFARFLRAHQQHKVGKLTTCASCASTTDDVKAMHVSTLLRHVQLVALVAAGMVILCQRQHANGVVGMLVSSITSWTCICSAVVDIV
jgi:hypothetical protein